MVNVENISFGYNPKSPQILSAVGFEIAPGDCIAALGVNGAGKSTLLKCINRILKPASGSVHIDSEDVYAMTRNMMAQRIAYVPQNAGAVNMTVFDAVLLGRKPYIKWDVTEHDRAVVSGIIEKLSLESYVLRPVSELSGGEAQKVMLARALAQEPRLLLLDEPTSNLDPKNQHQVMQLVRSIAAEHQISVIIVMHDLNLAIRYCNRFLFLKNGEVFASGGSEVMTPEIIESVYGMHVHITRCMGIPIIVPFPDIRVPDTDHIEIV